MLSLLLFVVWNINNSVDDHGKPGEDYWDIFTKPEWCKDDEDTEKAVKSKWTWEEQIETIKPILS